MQERDSAFVRTVFSAIMGRKPSDVELQEGLSRVNFGSGAVEYTLELSNTHEAGLLAAGLESAPLFVPLGHYYSPIVDVSQPSLLRHLQHQEKTPLLDVNIDYSEMQKLFTSLSNRFTKINFPFEADNDFRYYFHNDFYGYGDALVLSAMLQHFLPKKVIEVGSGFSSAVILDTIDKAGMTLSPICTFIEPHPHRLNSLLRESDVDRVNIINSGIQAVDLSLFETLNANDILFLDTTHVSRTGSDVNHEIFEILPRLKDGVIVHFHDAFANFEYPYQWVVKDNRSWNELYLLRAFLMNNESYQILFFNDAFAKLFPERVLEASPLMAKNAGGGLWMRKRSKTGSAQVAQNFAGKAAQLLRKLIGARTSLRK
ncbi:class I SAM-dependent methyltransferase [Methylobacterium planeticum]|uniref:Class I SAM-dependent methyltransferase n=1 Tax=Methylobacterium planeticum TaxID=2615211 RepID=A0A6N6MYN6_9HYPH|nr:class I SAM-dependent methyltransferase [Methylobacterium planeticum]KAB1075347.1 class I SAM-dependent methyltransferase [Methylobacterium planeticum]